MITSRQNSIIKLFRNQNSDEWFVVEGEKLITEALNAGFTLQHLLLTDKCKLELKLLGELKLPWTVITKDLAEYISDTKTPQGMFAMFERKVSHFDFNKLASADSRVMVLDGVRDPGNVGAIVRSCEAFQFNCVLLSDDSADLFNPKVIRASAGSVFRLPSIRDELNVLIPKLKQSGFIVYASALDEKAISLSEFNKADHTTTGSVAIVIGSEGQGVSENILALCDHKLYIPIKGAESLNASVAAGIICYEMANII